MEDNPADVRLTREAMRETGFRTNLRVVGDGVEAMAYLRREGMYRHAPRPDLILLDLNLPHKNGRSVLAELKSDESLKRIPVVVLTTSKAQEDIARAYDLNANCYITKPVDFGRFISVVKSIEGFWLTMAEFPAR